MARRGAKPAEGTGGGVDFPHELAPEQTQTRRYLAFDTFDTMDTQPAREALDRKRLAWIENVMVLAHNQLSVVPGPNTSPLQILGGETIARMFFAFVNGVDYAICFCASGAAYGVNLASGAATKFANAGTFTTTPDATVWADQAVLIADPQAGYCAWTGSGGVFSQTGSGSPNFDILTDGNGYISAPAVVITGGSATTPMLANATISGGNLTKITPTVAGVGYKVTDELLVFIHSPGSQPAGVIGYTIIDAGRGYTSAPTVTVTPYPGDPGSGATATAGVAGGSVVSMTVSQPGANYQNTPFVSIDGGGGVTNATVLPGAVGTIGGAITSIPLNTVGSGYTSTPMVYIIGDGNGASAIANMAGSTVASITVLNGGAGYTSANTRVFIQGGGGAIVAPILDNAASVRTQVWPTVQAPSTIAVFQGRVWLGAGRNLIYSGTTGFSDFNSANASGQTTITDPDLVHRITALRALNNFLFIFGDNSIKQVGSVTVSAGLTNFSIVTLSSDNGTQFPMSIVSYNRLVLFCNTQGIYAVFGASVEKISDPMDGIFRLVDFTQEPTAIVDDLFNLHTYQLLVKYKDPNLGTRSLILVFQQKRWCVVNAGRNVQHMMAAPLTTNPNTQITPYMTSSNDITAMYVDFTTPQPIILQTALSFDGNPFINKRALRAGIGQTITTLGGTLNISLDTEVNSNPFSVNVNNVFTFLNANNQPFSFLNSGAQTFQWILGNPGFQYVMQTVEGSGIYLGMSVTGSFSGANFHSFGIEYQTGALFVSNNLV